ncbi:metallophosphoesterase family protein [Candidatus Dependentiae bacterium]
MFFENKKQCIWGLLFIFLFPQLDAEKFIAMGDSHAGRGGSFKPGYAQYMQGLKEQYSDINFAILPGDLTDSGFINSRIETLGGFGEETLEIDGYGQWGKFSTYWINRLLNKNIEVYLCMGNHDMYQDKDQPITVADMIRWHHEDLNHKSTDRDVAYTFTKGNCHFICGGKYPDEDIMPWVRNYLEGIGTDAPVFFYFHYPLIRSKFDYFRNDFYDMIVPYNVKGIFTGHIYSYTAFWRDREFKLFGVGGYHFAVVDFDPDTGNISMPDTKFYGLTNYDGTGVWQEKDFYDPELYLGWVDTNNQIVSENLAGEFEPAI